MQNHVTHTPHHKTGKQSPSNNGSHGQGHRQAPQIQTLMNSPKYKKAWSLSAANECGQLANGIRGRIKNPTNTIEFISQHEVPVDRRKDVTYGQFVCSVRPKKAEPNQMQLAVGGNRINYPGKVATPTAEMLETKMLFNSVISMKGAGFMTMDISNFYLMTPLHCAEFIRIKLSDIPDEVIKEYKLREKATKNRSIYIRAKHGMYGLPQAGLLANKLLEKCLNKRILAKQIGTWTLEA
jgi:hypothetical protein